MPEPTAYLRNHIDFQDSNEVLEKISFLDILQARRTKAITRKINKEKEKGYLMYITFPFFIDYCCTCKGFIDRLDRDKRMKMYIKCRTGPSCSAFLELRKVSVGEQLK